MGVGSTLCSQQQASSTAPTYAHTQFNLPLPARVCEYLSQGISFPHSEPPQLPPHSRTFPHSALRPCSLGPVNLSPPLLTLPSFTGPKPQASKFLPQGLCMCCSCHLGYSFSSNWMTHLLETSVKMFLVMCSMTTHLHWHPHTPPHPHKPVVLQSTCDQVGTR